MLKFAVVGFHGRELAVRLLMRGVLLLVVSFTPAAAQAPARFEGLLSALVQKIASAIPAGSQVGLTLVTPDADDVAVLRTRLTAQLAARGIRIAAAGAPVVSIEVGCGENLRERVCIAEIHGDAGEQIATVTEPLGTGGERDPATVLAVELRPLLSRRTPILDAAWVRDRLLVLDATAVTLYERSENSWRERSSRPISGTHAWPRDVRGRLRVDGDRVDIFLPGTTCNGRLESLEISCVDRQQPWPLDIENGGLEAGRNFFRTREGLTFYNVAPLTPEAAARWLVAAGDGTLQLLNDAGKSVSTVGAGDDVVTLRAACMPGAYAVTAARGAGDAPRDELRLTRVFDGRVTQAGSPAILPGELTALWPFQDQLSSALVVTRDVNTGRYDALQASISCTR